MSEKTFKKNPYQEEFEKYKDCPLPEINEEWKLPTSPWYKPIMVKVTSYDGDYGEILTIHSNQKQKKTLHWLRKTFFKSKENIKESGEN